MKALLHAARRTLWSILLGSALVMMSPSGAAGGDLQEIASLLETDTLAAARIELGAIDFDQLDQSLFQTADGANGSADDASELVQQAEQFRQQLLASGATRLWLTLGLADISQGPALLLPSDNPEATLQLFRNLPPRAKRAMGTDVQMRLVDNVVVVAPPELAERLAGRPAASRADLAKGLEAAAEYPIAIAVVPTEDMRRVMREMLPDLPAELGGVSGRSLADAFASLSFGLDLASPAGALFRLAGETAESALAVLPAIRSAVERTGLPIATEEIRQVDNAIILRMDDAAVRAVAQALVEPLERSRAEARRMQSWNNLKQLGLAMHNYHAAHHHLPPSGKASDESAAGLSWRVHLLPYLDQAALYQQFKLDEPWDSPHNRQLIDKMPDIYRSPLASELPPGKTVYQLPRMEGSIYGAADGEGPPRFRDVNDGLSNTVLLFESNPAAAVTWTQPEDLQIDPDNLWQHLRAEGREYVSLLRADGSVHALPIDWDPESVRAMITRAGGERVRMP